MKELLKMVDHVQQFSLLTGRMKGQAFVTFGRVL